MTRAPRWLFWPFFGLAAGLLCVACLASVGCASWHQKAIEHTVGSDDHEYSAMQRMNVASCGVSTTFPAGSPCQKKRDALLAYRDAIQHYYGAAATPGKETYQKTELDRARAAAEKLLPVPK
jgi:hypothetical protein